MYNFSKVENNAPYKLNADIFENAAGGDYESNNTEAVTDDGALIDFAVCHVEGQNYTAAQSVGLAHG